MEIFHVFCIFCVFCNFGILRIFSEVIVEVVENVIYQLLSVGKLVFLKLFVLGRQDFIEKAVLGLVDLVVGQDLEEMLPVVHLSVDYETSGLGEPHHPNVLVLVLAEVVANELTLLAGVHPCANIWL